MFWPTRCWLIVARLLAWALARGIRDSTGLTGREDFAQIDIKFFIIVKIKIYWIYWNSSSWVIPTIFHLERGGFLFGWRFPCLGISLDIFVHHGLNLSIWGCRASSCLDIRIGGHLWPSPSHKVHWNFVMQLLYHGLSRIFGKALLIGIQHLGLLRGLWHNHLAYRAFLVLDEVAHYIILALVWCSLVACGGLGLILLQIILRYWLGRYLGWLRKVIRLRCFKCSCWV